MTQTSPADSPSPSTTVSLGRDFQDSDFTQSKLEFNQSDATLQALQNPPNQKASLEMPGTKEEEQREDLEASPPQKPQGVTNAFLARKVILAMIALLALFWFVASFILGKTYKVTDYGYRMHVVAVDLDGGAVGSILLQTAKSLNGGVGQPTWDLIPYPTTKTYQSIYDLVAAGNDVWGALVANPGSSQRLVEAIASANDTAYNASAALTIIYNESRYRTAEISIVLPKLQAATAMIASRLQQQHGASYIKTLPANATAENIAALLNPIQSTIDNIMPFGYSISVLTNTVLFVFPILGQFFLCICLNAVIGGMGKAYATWSLRRNLGLRYTIAIVNPLLYGLSWAGWVFIFKNGADFSTAQYFQISFTMMLDASINFNVIDAVMCFVPMQFMPFFVVSWVICQIATVLSPIITANNFFRITYVLPSHHTWGTLMTIFAKGANNHLKINLTVSFMLWVVAIGLNTFGQWTRWKKEHKAAAAEAPEEKGKEA